jgi:pimeloyl-ACP methyl ester carboxylesterase
VFATREEFTERILLQPGITPGIAAWLAMNVENTGSQYRYRVRTENIRELLADYFTRDAWSSIAKPLGRSKLDLVLGSRSRVFSDADRARAEQLVREREGLRVVTLEAGHWVHVDAPDALHEALTAVPLPLLPG